MNEDITAQGLTYDVEDTKVISGMHYENTPVVKRFEEVEGITYPCVFIRASREQLLAHQLNSLHNLTTADACDKRYDLYISTDDAVSQLGSIDSRSLKLLLGGALFNTWKIVIKLDKDTEYTDDFRYAFCST